ncbi:glycosyltransferase [Sphingomonas mucosissima]|nr:glycosyltransferase [Sphingomonas mucosissima]
MTNEITFALAIVTYGERAGLAKRVIESASTLDEVIEIVVIDNASVNPFRVEQPDISNSPQVTVIRHEENLGSAGGYNKAIRYFREYGQADYLILVDDDLLVTSNTIEGLQKIISTYSDDEDPTFVIPRTDRPSQTAIFAGMSSPNIRRNAFHDFHALYTLRSIVSARRKVSIPATFVDIDHAPYGGMVISKAVSRSAELPDVRFFVYCDDYDYTMKIRKSGSRVLLVDVTPLLSIDKSWNHERRRAPAAFYPAAPDVRVYYSTRNRVAFEMRYTVTNWPLYIINLLLFLLIGTIVAAVDVGISHDFIRRLRLISRAIRDGLTGRLGVYAPARGFVS